MDQHTNSSGAVTGSPSYWLSVKEIEEGKFAVVVIDDGDNVVWTHTTLHLTALSAQTDHRAFAAAREHIAAIAKTFGASAQVSNAEEEESFVPAHAPAPHEDEGTSPPADPFFAFETNLRKILKQLEEELRSSYKGGLYLDMAAYADLIVQNLQLIREVHDRASIHRSDTNV